MYPTDAFYDEASTIFSPDGRLLQVEYALEAVTKGSIALGLKFDDGVVLIAYKPPMSPLVEVQGVEKIFKIDDRIGCTMSGFVADAQHIVELAREEVQINKIRYGIDIPIKILVEEICDYMHLYTQFGGVRPFGIALLVAGIDEKGGRLFATDPSGAFFEYKAVSVGEGSNIAIPFLKRRYTDKLLFESALDLGLKTLKKAMRKKLQTHSLEIAVVNSNQRFYKLSQEEITQVMG